MKSCKVDIDAYAYFLWAFMLLMLPLKWMAAFFLAVVWHECFHLAALWLMGIKVGRIHIGIGGMKMEIPELPYHQECVCALAGPVGSLLLLVLYRLYPQLSICALIQSIYNLLPVYPLDGGRALRSAAKMHFADHADQICLAAELISIIAILIFSFIWKWGILSILVGFFLAGKLMRVKIPCKPLNLRVQ